MRRRLALALALAALCAPASAHGAAADQVHVSWIGDTSTTLTVVWHTQSSTAASALQYRRVGSAPWLQVSGAQRPAGTTGKLHEATLTGLAPAGEYEYRLAGDDGSFGGVYRTRTAPPAGHNPFDAVYFADTGIAGRTDGLATGTLQSIDEIVRLDPLLVLPGGDYAYYDSDRRFGSLENSIDAWFRQEEPIFSRSAVMPTYGNHEVLLGEGYSNWAARFATPTGIDGRRYYSFDVGDVHFVSLLAVSNPGALPTAAFNWLQSDIDQALARGQRWIIPYMHVPSFSDGTSHGSNTQLRAQLGPLFEQKGVKVVLTSHDQNYERTLPLVDVPSTNTPTSQSRGCYTMSDGVSWVKVSPAGKLSNHNNVNDFSHFRTNPPPSYTAFRDDTVHHFARLRVGLDSLRVEVYGVVGDGSPIVMQDAFEYRLDGCLEFARPGSATPLRVPLVPAYTACTAPNTSHVPPLDLPACSGPRLQSSIVTTAAKGAGSGRAILRALPGDPGTDADEADVRLVIRATDVRAAATGADYTGQLAATVAFRLTDRASGPPAQAATVRDGELSAPVDCSATASTLAGAVCVLSTSADTLLPGFAREGDRAVLSILSLALEDPGADGQIVPAAGGCPPTCGTGDERTFLHQGLFTP